MDMEQALLGAILDNPADEVAWSALADWLEERGDPRGELLRLTRGLLQPGGGERPPREERVRTRLEEGVRPCWPALTNSIGMRLVHVPAGTFCMGSPPREQDRHDDEGPPHDVDITRPFYLGMHPVTQEQFERVVGKNPSHFDALGANHPVEQVTWEEAALFCRSLSGWSEERRLRRLYRLPTEAEWEYACRGGTSSPTPFRYGASLSSTQANFDGRRPYGSAASGPDRECTTPVGSYRPNPLGLYDMLGNVFEWCADWFHPRYYADSSREDPPGPAAGFTAVAGTASRVLRSGPGRVLRGGSWSSPGRNCRSAFRGSAAPNKQLSTIGFRVAMTVLNETP
jgi:uncharacterized protein (TIGR02996 family)